MKSKRYISISIISFLLYLVMVLYASEDQIIYVKVSDFDAKKSQFNVDVAGNKWVETKEEGALFGVAYGAPGDNNQDAAGPYLVIKLPVRVKSGEATADGKKWVVWARMYEPGALKTGNLNNSIFFRMSPDAEKWTPQNRGSTNLLWNDPGGAKNNLLFPNSINGVDSIFTDLGDRLPWFWQNHKATVDAPRGPDSTIDPPLVVGDNYVELTPRESDPVDYPRIEIICFRNDGKQPSDAEALGSFSVSSQGKLTLTWGKIKCE